MNAPTNRSTSDWNNFQGHRGQDVEIKFCVISKSNQKTLLRMADC